LSDLILKSKTFRLELTVKILFIFLFIFTGYSNHFAKDDFEIVESVPVETMFENSPLNRTAEVWKQMIRESKTSISIETFYFADEINQPMNEIIDELKAASARGVQIRIIVDSSFYSRNDKSVDSLEGYVNISIRKIPMGNIAGGVMHAKYFITDNENVFLGSQNFDWRALIHIHEIGARINSKRLAETFNALFENDWNLCIGKNESEINTSVVNKHDPVILHSQRYGQMKIYPAFSPHNLILNGMSEEETELTEILEKTRDRLLIQVYSFSPAAGKENFQYMKIDSLLRNAAGRGVKIKLILPNWALRDKSTDFLKNLSLVENIEIKIISIPIFSGGFIPYSRVDHSKYFVSDDNISWISTSNWEWGYFNNSRNATLIIDNEQVNSELKSVFYRSWDSPYSEIIDVNKTYEPVKRY